MNVSQYLKLQNKVELNQKLSLTLSMRQAIDILRMGHLELSDYLQHQALENPVLELGEPDYDERVALNIIQQQIDWLAEYPEENDDDYSASLEKQPWQWNIAAGNNFTLEEHLLAQLNLLTMDEPTYQIARYIIQSLDEKGYLKTDLKFMAEVFAVSVQKVDSALKVVQSLEPCGVGARSLPECLKLQLRKAGYEDKMLFAIVDKHLHELGKNRLKAVANELGVSVEKVKEMYSIIRSLNPYPGWAFGPGNRVQYIKPDVLVIKYQNRLEVELNDSCLPTITINDLYRKILKDSADQESKEYISRKINQASWLIRSVLQRNNTLLEICRQIATLQKDFFMYGPGHLRPLTQREIASLINLHESTVSRGINDKYLQCSWGIYPLKYFFTSGFDPTSQNEMTAEKIKTLIQQLILAENKKRPYSDEKITQLLKEKGFTVARRTVSKYREQMAIPSASGRKEF